MPLEPTSLSLAVYRIGDTLKAVYGIDPGPMYERLGIDPAGPSEVGERQPNRIVSAAFEEGAALTGDRSFGIRVGLHSEPRHFFVIGHVWLASATLVEAIRRLLRYEAILNSSDTVLEFRKLDRHYMLKESYPNPANYPGTLRADAAIASIIRLCNIACDEPIFAERLDLYGPDGTPVDIYRPLVRGPVSLTRSHNAIYLDARRLEAPLPGSIPEVVDSTCRIADRYLASLDSETVAREVRAQLVKMLPSGDVDQQKVADTLHRSTSTLQRQLSVEGLTYRDVLDDTRRELAEAYLRERRHTLAQIAFLLGFADQGNFARAFKRWTGMSPRQFRQSAA
jgi:AraC-like DNA-binding protein